MYHDSIEMGVTNGVGLSPVVLMVGNNFSKHDTSMLPLPISKIPID
jgi:hypothetical protein